VRLPGSAFGVAIDDLLANACVYVKDAGFFASSGIAKRDMASYRASIKGRETYLDQIRRMPDQKFGNALKALYIRAQDRSPTMLSLACDNRKAVVDRAGQIGFGPMWMQPSTQLRSKHMITPTFGSGANLRLSDGAVADCPGYTRSMENGWMPIPQITIKEGPLAYRETVFVAPADRKTPGAGSPSPVNARPLCAAEYVVENSQAAPAAASFKLAFMADTEKGVAALVRMDGHRVIVTRGDKLLAIVGLTDLKGLRAEVKGSELALRGTLAAGQTARCWAYAPLEWDAKAEELADGENLHAAAASYWQRLIAQGMKIDIPDKLLQNLIDASQAHCMIAARTTDAGKCIEPWIAAAYYGALDTESHSVIHGMDMLGQGDFARRALDYFLKRENPVGYLSHGYTMMGTGQHLWFLSDHYRLTGDSRWWRDVSPKVANICQWIDRQCRKTMRKDPFGQEVPEFGLVPPGTVADWQDWGYIFSMEGYYYAGLSRAARALAEIGHPKAEELAQAAERFKGDILRAYHWTQARAPVVPRGDGTWVPWYPMRLYKPGPCEQFFPNYNGSWLYDVELGAHHMVDEGVLDPQSAEVAWMADNMENVQFMKDSATSAQLSAAASQQDWFNRGGFPKCQPYYGRYLELCALRDDVKPFLRSYFNQLAAMFNREDLSIYENPGASVWNKTHETGHFLQQTRLMFVMERGDELWLAPFVTNQWIKDGMTVAIGDALSYFGPVSYSIRSHVAQGYIEATVDRPIRKLPKALVVRLRHPDGKQMSRVTVNGRVWTDFDVKRETVRIEHPEGRVTVTAYFY